MKLVAVRHGQAEGNTAHLIMSRKDVGLTEIGHQQAEELAGKLNKFNFDAIYSSPLYRAVDTVKPLASKKNLTIKIDNRLIEVDWGKLIDQPERASQKIFGRTFEELYSSLEYDLTEFGGESARQVESRVRNFLEDLKKTDAKEVCVATHDGIVHWFYYIIEGRKISRDPNASIHEFSI